MGLVQDRAGTGGRAQRSTSSSGATAVEEVAEALCALTRDLENQDDPESMLAAIVAAAVALIPGAEEGSISIVLGRRRIRSEAPTGELPRRVDALQEELQQGPCLDVAYQQQTVRVSDLTDDDRWPLLAARAAETGAVSMLSLQLSVEGDNLRALNLYARTVDAFTDDSEQMGLLVAAHAALAYVSASRQAHLVRALVTRDLIGQAKGILTERYQITGDNAFLLLTRISQNSNRKLHQVAAELVDSGTITGADALPPTPR